MNIERKLEIAKRAVASICEHDSAPIEFVDVALEALGRYAEEQRAAAVERRAAAEAPAVED